MNYSDFLERKATLAPSTGFEPPAKFDLKRPLFDFQQDIVRWALRRGRCALFEDCGMGKTAQQLTWANEVAKHTRKPVLILAPLAVAEQTKAEGADMGIEVDHVTQDSDCRDTGIAITNYEKMHRIDTDRYIGVAADESSCIKAMDSKTTAQMIETFANTPYKLACTATPAPNDYMELGNHAEFLGVMTREEMLAMFFTHDSGNTSQWRLKGHAQDDFWRWLCSWAVNIRRPSDIGYDDGAFKLPPLNLYEHVVQSSQTMEGYLFALPASSLEERRNARKASLSERVEQAAKIANKSREQWIVWCNLNSESEALADEINGAVEVTGSDSEDHKVAAVRGFLSGEHRVLISKPTIFGFGLNLQCCHNELFVGLSDSYEQFYQAVRRCWRFGQTKPVNAHLVISDLEGAVLANLKRKENDAKRMGEQMVKHMADITSAEIRGSHRNTTVYKAEKPIALPSFL